MDEARARAHGEAFVDSIKDRSSEVIRLELLAQDIVLDEHDETLVDLGVMEGIKQTLKALYALGIMGPGPRTT